MRRLCCLSLLTAAALAVAQEPAVEVVDGQVRVAGQHIGTIADARANYPALRPAIAEAARRARIAARRAAWADYLAAAYPDWDPAGAEPAPERMPRGWQPDWQRNRAGIWVPPEDPSLRSSWEVDEAAARERRRARREAIRARMEAEAVGEEPTP